MIVSRIMEGSKHWEITEHNKNKKDHNRITENTLNWVEHRTKLIGLGSY